VPLPKQVDESKVVRRFRSGDESLEVLSGVSLEVRGGELVLLEEQDRARWDHDMIDEGVASLDRAIAIGSPGPYQGARTLSKNFYPTASTRLQFRAEFINAFNQVQWLADPNVGGLDNTCTSSNTTCTVAADRFGQIIATRAAREIQLGIKLYW